MVTCIPVAPDGTVDPRWGRAARVAVMRVEGGEIARFLQEHRVELVVADHMGGHMARMLEGMGIAVRLGAAGQATAAVASAARSS
jgi:predicted Fe-Mo cluster-binding NifX family protein